MKNNPRLKYPLLYLNPFLEGIPGGMLLESQPSLDIFELGPAPVADEIIRTQLLAAFWASPPDQCTALADIRVRRYLTAADGAFHDLEYLENFPTSWTFRTQLGHYQAAGRALEVLALFHYDRAAFAHRAFLGQSPSTQWAGMVLKVF